MSTPFLDLAPPDLDSHVETESETISFDPATGARLGASPLDDLSALQAAMAAARAAHPAWAARPMSDRQAALRRMRDWLMDHADEVARVVSQDVGKTRTDAMISDVVNPALHAEWYARHAPRVLGDHPVEGVNWLLSFKRSFMTYEPWGVVAVLSPWNYPLGIPVAEVWMALVAGNAVILKVASETQMVGRLIERMVRESDVPDGVFHYLNLPVPQAGDWIFQVGIDKVFFTGSVRVGKILARAAAETLTPISLELGGNDAMIVCADADLERAVGGALWAGMQNAGQSCAGVERIYVEAPAHDAFVSRLAAAVRALRVGVDTGDGIDVGAMATRRQLVTVQRHVDDALARGATIAAQAPLPEGLHGLFAAPTLLVGVDHHMACMREETFGPLLAVMKVENAAEAVRLANDSDYGLTGSVWSRDEDLALALARRIHAGAVMINDHLTNYGMADTPWGGFKQSGLGRTHGAEGLLEMVQPRVIVRDRLAWLMRAMPWWHPHGPVTRDAIRGLMFAAIARTPVEVVRGLWALRPLLGRVLRGPWAPKAIGTRPPAS